MAFNKGTQTNIDNSDLTNYPHGQIRDNDGSDNGTPVARVTMSDMFETFDKLMRLAQITYNGLYDNETNGYQFVQAWVALANKNDFILSLTSASGILQIPTATNILQTGEKLVVQAAADYVAETQIKGTGAALLTISISRQYKANDYLLLVKTLAGITIISLLTSDNLSVVGTEKGFLKKTSDAVELAGTDDTTATTPKSNKTVFTKRVNDNTESVPYLVSHAQNGIMSAADKIALDGFASPIKNIGSFSGLDVGSGSIGDPFTTSGDITNAVIQAVDPSDTVVTVTMLHAMANTNYFVRSTVQSQGTIAFDNDIGCPVFTPISTTQFRWSVSEILSGTQSLKIILEVVQL